MPRRISPSRKCGAVVLLSGGLDSAYNLAAALNQYLPVEALTVDYGQRAARAELKAARALCRYYGVPHHVIRFPWLGSLAPQAMVKRGDVLPTRAGFADIWVPNRNGVFLALAAAHAEYVSAGTVIAGFNAEEAEEFPDNSAAFIRATNRALAYSTAGAVAVKSFSSRFDKKEIVIRGDELGVPWELIYPCYGDGPYPCGVCPSCRRARRAFRAAARADVADSLFRAKRRARGK